MSSEKLFGWQMAVISETYLSILSSYMKPYGIERYFIALLVIHEHKVGMSQQELGRLLKRDKVTVMRMIDYLENQGLVSRREDPTDRRRHKLEITKAGKKLIPKIEEATLRTNESLLGKLNEQESEIFFKGMKNIMRRLDELPEADFVVKAFRKKRK